jgi:hemolysin activation/secretion protein
MGKQQQPRGRGLSAGTQALVAAAIAAGAAGAAAQQGQPAPAAGPVPPVSLQPAPEPVFAIRGFQVTGENPLGEAEVQRILAPYVRERATIGTLQEASAALETALRNAGYGLHRVALPAQQVGAAVRLEIVTFAVSKVAIEGATLYDAGNVRGSIPELQEGRTPNFKRLAVQTAIANENPNKQLQVGIREGEEPDKIDATVTVREKRPWTFAVGLNNSGSQATGRDRLTVSGGHTNLFNRDHQLTAAWTTSLESGNDVKQLGLSYRVPLYALGGVVGASYTTSDVVGNFGAFNSTGAGSTFGLNWTFYLPPEGGRRSYVVLGLDDKVFRAARINSVVVPGALDRRSRPLTIGYNARTESDRAIWGYTVDFAANTGTGSDNDLAAYRTEDPRIDRLHWKVLRGSFSWVAPVAGNWLASARSNWQYSPDVLLAGEQIGLGGLASVRGTEIERPLSADKGLTASVELTTPELAPGLRAAGFVDAGYVRNNRPNGFNKPASDGLASIGLGLRWTAGPVTASLDYARLVDGSSVSQAFNSAAPRKGDERLYVNLSVRF